MGEMTTAVVFIIGLFVGANIGVGLMCLLDANRPSAYDAIWHLQQMYNLRTKTDDVIYYPRGGTIDCARRFLLRYGDGEQRP